jgi:predicted GNAT family acetyltransferase
MSNATDNPARHRYEMEIDGETAFVTYARHGDRLTLIHTEVPKVLSGRGIGTKLARSVLEDVRRLGLRVVPECEFMAGFIQRNPAFTDLLAGP